MLQQLRIANLALLDAVELEFGEGFVAVTGETGAGKSVLLGALSLLAGARGDRALIRAGADACELEAVLGLADPGPVDAVLEAAGLPPCEEGQLLLRRVLHRDRPPRCAVNGRAAPVALLEELGGLWIDFHGPAEPRRLLRPECQLEMLDTAGGLAPAAAAYREQYDAWRAARRAREEAGAEADLPEEQADFLRRQVEAIDRLRPTAESVAALERDFHRAQQAAGILEAAAGLADGLGGDRGVAAQLAPLVRAARRLAELDAAAGPLADRVAALAVEAADVARDCEALAGGLDLAPAARARLEERMAAWLEVRRRHGPELEDVLRRRAEMAARLARQADRDGILARAREAEAAALAAVRAGAAALRAERLRAGAELARRLGPVVAGLGFKRADFAVEAGEPGEPGPHGDARLEFLFSPNPGAPLQPLARIASSGELARVMLALKTVLAAADRTPVLVFDEVDANVGGEIGRVVGERLAEVARGHQVFVVTHLPQVACLAAQHILVEKTAGERATTIAIRPLQGDRGARIDELARMLGDRGGAAQRALAQGMLAAAGGAGAGAV